MTERRQLVERIWARDPAVWTGRDEGRWLGWLDEPARMRADVESIARLAEDVRGDLESVVLLGMGGSSLGADVLRRVVRSESFHVLDTTHPGAIRRLEDRIDPAQTLFVAASKSGATVDTRAQLEYFWERVPRGEQWLAITDPASALASLARERRFAAVAPGEPTIGGRYSALSPFGLVPAALLGIDLVALLDSALEMAAACRLDDGNPGLELGLSLAAGWRDGRDKVCFTDVSGFGLWVEQLVAESTGKDGKGLVPAAGEHGDGPDRQRQQISHIDAASVGAEFFRWEFAVAVAGALLRINPFDQPDVQAAKDRTKEVLAGPDRPLGSVSSLEALLAQAGPGDYLAIQAFVDPDAAAPRIEALAEELRSRTGCVVTTGFGPGYLHSTGQLHKGGANNGLFLQVVDGGRDELPIPGWDFGFGRLIRAQAAGDLAALQERGRRVARIQLDELP
ncbi:MAG: hypothetical protein WCH31_01525 [Actinomycetes bacterium]